MKLSLKNGLINNNYFLISSWLYYKAHPIVLAPINSKKSIELPPTVSREVKLMPGGYKLVLRARQVWRVREVAFCPDGIVITHNPDRLYYAHQKIRVHQSVFRV